MTAIHHLQLRPVIIEILGHELEPDIPGALMPLQKVFGAFFQFGAIRFLQPDSGEVLVEFGFEPREGVLIGIAHRLQQNGYLEVILQALVKLGHPQN